MSTYKTLLEKLLTIKALLAEPTAEAKVSNCPCCDKGNIGSLQPNGFQALCGVCDGEGTLTERRVMKLYRGFLAHEALIAACKPKDTPHVR
jgi:hypothetical protein